jgi:hypothetical protein
MLIGNSCEEPLGFKNVASCVEGGKRMVATNSDQDCAKPVIPFRIDLDTVRYP